MNKKTDQLNQEWFIPEEVIKKLGKFDLDPCSSSYRPWNTATVHFNKRDNGLIQKWFGRVWLNPPFNRDDLGRWMARMRDHNDGIMMVPALFTSKEWAHCVWGRCAGLLIFREWPELYRQDGSTSLPVGEQVCLVAYGKENFDILRGSGLGHPLVQEEILL